MHWEYFYFVFLIQDLLRSDIPWSQAKSRIEEGNVDLIEIDGEIVKIHLKDPDEEFKTSILQTVYIPQDETFLPLIESQNIVYRATPTSGCESGASLLSTFFILGFFAYFFAFTADRPWRKFGKIQGQYSYTKRIQSPILRCCWN